jgi:hypothetical protein
VTPALRQSIYRSNSSKNHPKITKIKSSQNNKNVSHECSYNIALRHTTQQHNRKIQILSSVPIIFHKKIYPDSIFNTKKVNCSWSISVAGWNFANQASFGRRILQQQKRRWITTD